MKYVANFISGFGQNGIVEFDENDMLECFGGEIVEKLQNAKIDEMLEFVEYGLDGLQMIFTITKIK